MDFPTRTEGLMKKMTLQEDQEVDRQVHKTTALLQPTVEQ
jgi:2-methylcitrate dehydratase PrpD